MLFGVAWSLKEVQEKLPGRVLLVFQFAEEMAPTGRAQPMMEEGVFGEHQSEAILA